MRRKAKWQTRVTQKCGKDDWWVVATVARVAVVAAVPMVAVATVVVVAIHDRSGMFVFSVPTKRRIFTCSSHELFHE